MRKRQLAAFQQKRTSCDSQIRLKQTATDRISLRALKKDQGREQMLKKSEQQKKESSEGQNSRMQIFQNQSEKSKTYQTEIIKNAQYVQTEQNNHNNSNELGEFKNNETMFRPHSMLQTPQSVTPFTERTLQSIRVHENSCQINEKSSNTIYKNAKDTPKLEINIIPNPERISNFDDSGDVPVQKVTIEKKMKRSPKKKESMPPLMNKSKSYSTMQYPVKHDNSALAIINNLQATRDSSNMRKQKRNMNGSTSNRSRSNQRSAFAFYNNENLIEKAKNEFKKQNQGSLSPINNLKMRQHLVSAKAYPDDGGRDSGDSVLNLNYGNSKGDDTNNQTNSLYQETYSNTQRLEFNQKDYMGAGEKTQRIKIMARFRPLNKQEQKMKNQPNNIFSNQISFSKNDPNVVDIVDLIPRNSEQQQRENEFPKMSFKFDNVFKPQSSQKEVYEVVAKDIVNDALNGYNSTVLAYGQTGSGKTYTMYGKDHTNKDLKGQMTLDDEFHGIIPRIALQIIDQVNAMEKASVDVKLSMVEIYQEQFIDLLTPQPMMTGDHLIDDQIKIPFKELKLKENVNKETYIQGLTSAKISNADEIVQLLKLGELNRHVNSTRQNKISSRSHAICTIEINSYFNGNNYRGLINLVDLAGSERVSKSFAKGSALQEAKKINASLSTLGKVISAISKNAPHIPFRDSKLTRLLKESLGGNNKTTLIVNCSSHFSQIEETLSTMRFAQSAKMIQNKLKMNMQSEKSNYNEQNEILSNLVQSLQKELQQTKYELGRVQKELSTKYASQEQSAENKGSLIHNTMPSFVTNQESLLSPKVNHENNRNNIGGMSNPIRIDSDDHLQQVLLKNIELQRQNKELKQQIDQIKMQQGISLFAENKKLENENKRLQSQLNQNDEVLEKYIQAVEGSYKEQLDQSTKQHNISIKELNEIIDTVHNSPEEKVELLKSELINAIFKNEQQNYQNIQTNHEIKKQSIEISHLLSLVEEYDSIVKNCNSLSNGEGNFSEFIMTIYHQVQKAKDIYSVIKQSLRENSIDGLMHTINSSAFAPKLYNLTQSVERLNPTNSFVEKAIQAVNPNLQSYMKNIKAKNQANGSKSFKNNSRDKSLTFAQAEYHELKKSNVFARNSTESRQKQQSLVSQQKKFRERIQTQLNQHHDGELMVQFSYETKNLRMRSRQKQLNRHLTASGGWSFNSRQSKCSRCRNRVNTYNRSDEESCEECNLLMIANNSVVQMRQSRSNELKNDQQTKDLVIMGSGTPSFNFEKMKIHNVTNLHNKQAQRNDNNLDAEIISSPRQIQTSIQREKQARSRPTLIVQNKQHFKSEISEFTAMLQKDRPSIVSQNREIKKHDDNVKELVIVMDKVYQCLEKLDMVSEANKFLDSEKSILQQMMQKIQKIETLEYKKLKNMHDHEKKTNQNQYKQLSEQCLRHKKQIENQNSSHSLYLQQQIDQINKQNQNKFNQTNDLLQLWIKKYRELKDTVVQMKNQQSAMKKSRSSEKLIGSANRIKVKLSNSIGRRNKKVAVSLQQRISYPQTKIYAEDIIQTRSQRSQERDNESCERLSYLSSRSHHSRFQNNFQKKQKYSRREQSPNLDKTPLRRQQTRNQILRSQESQKSRGSVANQPYVVSKIHSINNLILNNNYISQTPLNTDQTPNQVSNSNNFNENFGLDMGNFAQINCCSMPTLNNQANTRYMSFKEENLGDSLVSSSFQQKQEAQLLQNKHQYSFDRRTNEENDYQIGTPPRRQTTVQGEYKNQNERTIVLPINQRATKMTQQNEPNVYQRKQGIISGDISGQDNQLMAPPVKRFMPSNNGSNIVKTLISANQLNINKQKK